MAQSHLRKNSVGTVSALSGDDHSQPTVIPVKKLPVKKLESASEQTTPDGDCVPTVPVVAEDSAFVDS
ncbi:MAG: hypothetical protein KJO98_00210, partial [Rhodothermia bacterium]|nr:hypothetical protein [Rhodothermia bacterium]